MKAIKNILVGFPVSFIGSIPLGYLNIIGFHIYTKLGIEDLILYLVGVVFVEGFVIYFTLVFANRLVNNIKVMRIIDVFGIFFLLLLAYAFYSHSNQTATDSSYFEKYMTCSPFLIGLILSSLNFLQLPFWTGWNLYLINGNYITSKNTLKLYYVAGTVVGTFTGMMGFVFFLNNIIHSSEHF
jgi:hypothetical protein